MNGINDVVDFHTHILPGIDHGCDSLQTAREQLRLAGAVGVSRVVLTPHFYPHVDNIESFIKRRNEAYDQLVSSLSSDDYPEVRLGTEVLICEGIGEMPRIDEFCIRGTKNLLLELPFSDFSKGYVDGVEQLISSGYNVILAHADRYDQNNIDKLVSIGAKVQLNAEALAGLFISSKVRSWLDSGCVCAIGSDIHMLDRSAYGCFKLARKRIFKKYGAVVAASNKIWSDSKK